MKVASGLIILPDCAAFLVVVAGRGAGILLALMEEGPAVFSFRGI